MGAIGGLLVATLLIVSCSSRQAETESTGGTEASESALVLHIHLQDGFDGNQVTITIDGSQVAGLTDVTTSLLTGLADGTVVVPLKSDATSVEVTIDPGSLRAVYEIQDRGPTPRGQDVWLGVSVEGSQITFVESDQAFGYA